MDAAAAGGRPPAEGIRRVRAEPSAGGPIRAEGVERRTVGIAPLDRGIRKGDAMNLLEPWVQPPAAAALGWTLAHSLWQGALVALVLAAAFPVLRTSHGRYTAACLAMLAVLASFCYTFQHSLAQQQLQNAPQGLAVRP